MSNWSPQSSLPANFHSVVTEITKYENTNEQINDLLFSELNPFFKDGKTWIKTIDKTFRFVGMFHHNQKIDGKKTAFFGFWDTINDLKINQKYFLQFESWAKKQGAEQIVGPINFSTHHDYRINLSSDQSDLFFKEPFNPEHYKNILENIGFTSKYIYHSYFLDNFNRVQKWFDIQNNFDMSEIDDKYDFVQVDSDFWMNNLEEIYKKSEIVFGENFAFQKLDKNLFSLIYGQQFSHAICSKTSLVVIHKETAEIVGICINFPDFLSQKKRILIKTAGIAPDHRFMGLTFIRLMQKLSPLAMKHYDLAVFCLMRDGNFPSLIGKELADRTRSYALFHKTI